MSTAPHLGKWNLSDLVEIDRSRTSAVYRVTLPDSTLAVLKCLTPVGVADERCGAVNRKRIGELADRFAVALGQDRGRILQYAFAQAALSSTWTLLEGGNPRERMDVAALIAKQL